MLAGLFRSNQPAVLFAVPLVALVLFAPTFFQPASHGSSLMPLALGFERLLGASSWAQCSMGLLLVTVLSLQLASLVNGLELMDRRNHLVAFLFPVVLAGSGVGFALEPALLGMPLVIFALRRTWSVSNTGAALGILFDAGFVIGLAAMCFLPYAFLLVVVWATISLVRPFAWREYVLPLLGLGLVFYLTWAVLHFMDATPWYPLFSFAEPSANHMDLGPDPVRSVWYILGAIILFFAIAPLVKGYSRSVMQGKNIRAAFAALTCALGVIAAGSWLINRTFPALFVAIPVAVYMSHALLVPRRPWLAEVATWSFFVLALWLSWY